MSNSKHTGHAAAADWVGHPIGATPRPDDDTDFAWRLTASRKKRGLPRSFGIAAIPLAAGIGVGFWSAHLGHRAEPAPPSLAQILRVTAMNAGENAVLIMNLVCAEGLPGTEHIVPSTAGCILDQWAKRVASETTRHLYKFQRSPKDYYNSEAYFRVLVMITVLQQDFGIQYNPERITAPDFSNPKDLFLHGLLFPPHRGTCVSMPVLYVAIGRRLGYPMRLVTAKAHLFARWENPDGTHLNVEATNHGLNCFPDEYYREWPVHMNDEELRTCGYLKSLTPAEELAVFLSARGHCFEALGRIPDAMLAYAQAHKLAPESPVYLAFLANCLNKIMPNWTRVKVDFGQAIAPTRNVAITDKPPR